MKRCLLLLALFIIPYITNAQNLDSLFQAGQNKQIIDAYKATGTPDKSELEIVAAAYDRLGRLEEEDEVLARLINSYPLFLTYMTPSGYSYYGNFTRAGLMERYRTAIMEAYLQPIKDTSLGRAILNAYYQDQSIREKFDDNKYSKKAGLKVSWDSVGLMKEWTTTDSANAPLVARIIRDHKGFPSKSTIGLIGTHSLFIIMQHLDVKWRDQYDQALFDAACKNDIDMVDYAMYKTMSLVRTKRIPDSLFQYTLDSLSEVKCR